MTGEIKLPDSQRPPSREEAIAKLVEPFLGQVVQRGTNTVPAHALTTLANAAYEEGAAHRIASAFGDVSRQHVCAVITREILEEIGSPFMGPAHVAVYRLLGDVYSAAKQHGDGLQRDVRERAAGFVESFRETYRTAPDSKTGLSFLLELFVNALLEARETAHHVDWSNPDQVELYTLAVEAESKRYEEINLKIAEAEKAERPAFADTALQDIPTWFDEMHPNNTRTEIRAGSDVEVRDYLAQNDPLFAAALNRAFALGVLSAAPQTPAVLGSFDKTPKAP